MTYDNSSYWIDLHRKLHGELRAVGWPGLSEEYNKLKYQSESESITKVLDSMLGRIERKDLSILDVGAGIGYFSNLVAGYLKRNGFLSSITAIDISESALEIASRMNPGIRTLQVDLKSVDVDRFRETFDMAMSFYCLHHIVRFRDFLNALTFSARSVKTGGFLIIMDPILSKPYSRFDTFDYYSFRENGLPRHLFLLDDLLDSEGLRRISLNDAISFILNGNIEGESSAGYSMRNILWKAAGKFIYPYDKMVARLSMAIITTDRWLKKNHAYSSKICFYEKIPASKRGTSR
jgi:SAM-dependent methyltransferase